MDWSKNEGVTMESQKIKEAEELARKILVRKVRKSMGIYYVLWSSLIVDIEVISSIIPHQFFLYVFSALIVAYVTYSMDLFRKTFSKRAFLETPKRVKGLLFDLALATMIASYFVAIDLLNDFTLSVISIAIYVAVISYSIYNVVSFTGNVRYYDYIAIASFIISETLGYFNYVFYFVYFFPWLYAGVKSIIESYEG